MRPTSACAKCVCLVADDSGEHLVVERLRNSSSAVIGCLDVSIRHNPQSSSTRYQSSAAGVVNTNDSINRYNSGPKTETFVYVDNVAVARRARRRGAAKALLKLLQTKPSRGARGRCSRTCTAKTRQRDVCTTRTVLEHAFPKSKRMY